MSNNLISEAFIYTKDGFVCEWKRWLLLTALLFVQSITFSLIPLFNGYLLRVGGSKESAPDINADNLIELFIKGWKVLIVELVYMLIIPLIIYILISSVFNVILRDVASVAGAGMAYLCALIYFGILLIAMFMISLFFFMGFIRLGQTDKFGEAFNFSAIEKIISNGLGWLSCVGHCLLLWILIVLYGVVILYLITIPVPFVGYILALIFTPLVSVFAVSYFRNIYNTSNTDN